MVYELWDDKNISIPFGTIFWYQTYLLHIPQIVPNFKEKQLQKFTLGNKVYNRSIELNLIEFIFTISVNPKDYKATGHKSGQQRTFL